MEINNNKENDKKINSKESKNKDIRNIAKYSSLGIEFGSIVVLTSFLGMFLDKKLSTRPILTIIGIFLGFFLAVYRLYLIIKDIDKNK